MATRAERIRGAFDALHMSTTEIAARLGVARQSVHRWWHEGQVDNLPAAHLLAIARLTGRTARYLWSGEEDAGEPLLAYDYVRVRRLTPDERRFIEHVVNCLSKKFEQARKGAIDG
jgi:transcriptional regulator with XRE-family HTH domain